MAIIATTKVLTHNNWKFASKIEVGDYLFDKDGQPTKVIRVQEYYAQDCYRVTLCDGITISGDKNLTFPTENPKYRKRICEYKGVQKFRRPLKLLSIKDLLELPLTVKSGAKSYSIPSTKAIALPTQDLPVHPFVFGFWFFNRNINNQINIPKEHKDVVIQKFKDAGYKIVHWRCKKTHRRVYSTEPRVEMQLIARIPIRIPQNFLLASPEQRIALLSGILYSKRKQYNPASDTFRITNRTSAVMRQVQGLVESLGIKTNLSYRQDANEYTLTFRSKILLMDHQVPTKIKVHQARRYIEFIKKIEPQMCVHIETQGADKSFLVEEGFISCLWHHNKNLG